MNKRRILIIDDEPGISSTFSRILSEEGYQILASPNADEALTTIRKDYPDLVFMDISQPNMEISDAIQQIKETHRNIPVIVLTDSKTMQAAMETLKFGAYDYLTKPLPCHRIKIIVDHALGTGQLSEEVGSLKAELDREFSIHHIIAASPQMEEVMNLVRKVAGYDVTVMLRGESGTGKELVARAIHQASPRCNKPFVAVDCATLPETLVESELFGYERGAFTGAQNNKLGKFEMAHEGTIFLDEIGNLNPQSQIKLLRVLQERAIDRLGGKKLVKVDVRVIAATNVNLEKALRDGHFREDLYHRLNVFSLVLPPLREREGDIIYLSKHFLDKYNKEFSKSIRGIAQGTLKLLSAYHWPGNVRELENVIKSAIILADEELHPRHLPPAMQQKVASSESGLRHSLRNVARDASHKAEQAMIQQALKESNWNKKKASRLLGVDYKTLYNKMKAYGINFSPNGV